MNAKTNFILSFTGLIIGLCAVCFAAVILSLSFETRSAMQSIETTQKEYIDQVKQTYDNSVITATNHNWKDEWQFEYFERVFVHQFRNYSDYVSTLLDLSDQDPGYRLKYQGQINAYTLLFLHDSYHTFSEVCLYMEANDYFCEYGFGILREIISIQESYAKRADPDFAGAFYSRHPERITGFKYDKTLICLYEPVFEKEYELLEKYIPKMENPGYFDSVVKEMGKKYEWEHLR